MPAFVLEPEGVFQCFPTLPYFQRMHSVELPMDGKRTYELTYILTGVLSEAQIKEDVQKINEFIEGAGGTLIDVYEWGARRMAYPIEKKRNGYYVNLYFSAPTSLVPRLERALTIDDHVLRYLTLALDKHMLTYFEARRKSGPGVPKEL